MNSIYLIIETYTNGYIGEFLDILSLISIIFGLFILISKNPIVSVLFLIFLFSSVSIYLIMLGINFLDINPRGLGDYFSIITQIFNSNIEISYATSKN